MLALETPKKFFSARKNRKQKSLIPFPLDLINLFFSYNFLVFERKIGKENFRQF